jgi:hypothetical protein
MSMANLRAESPAFPAPEPLRRDTAQMSKRARLLKAQLSNRLRAVRVEHALDRDDVFDKPSFVSRWENPAEPHAPNLLHLVTVGHDERSRPYALEALRWATEELEREDADPRQLSLFANP